ncbi:MAG: hypothetical protein WA632_15495 [Gallionella sp.]
MNAQSHFGWTPPHKAAANGDMDIAKLIVNCGARVRVAKPHDLSSRNGHTTIAAMLTSKPNNLP